MQQNENPQATSMLRRLFDDRIVTVSLLNSPALCFVSFVRRLVRLPPVSCMSSPASDFPRWSRIHRESPVSGSRSLSFSIPLPTSLDSQEWFKCIRADVGQSRAVFAGEFPPSFRSFTPEADLTSCSITVSSSDYDSHDTRMSTNMHVLGHRKITSRARKLFSNLGGGRFV